MLKLSYGFILTIFFTGFLLHAQAESNISAAEESAAEAPDTLIAVAAEEATEAAEIHTQISQAPHFLLFAHDGSFLKSVPLPSKIQGKRDALSQFLVEQQVTLLIAAHYDENDLNSLTAHDIIPIERQGVALDEVMRLLQCEPKPPTELAVEAEAADEADSEAHSQTAPPASAQ